MLFNFAGCWERNQHLFKERSNRENKKESLNNLQIIDEPEWIWSVCLN